MKGYAHAHTYRSSCSPSCILLMSHECLHCFSRPLPTLLLNMFLCSLTSTHRVCPGYRSRSATLHIIFLTDAWTGCQPLHKGASLPRTLLKNISPNIFAFNFIGRIGAFWDNLAQEGSSSMWVHVSLQTWNKQDLPVALGHIVSGQPMLMISVNLHSSALCLEMSGLGTAPLVRVCCCCSLGEIPWELLLTRPTSSSVTLQLHHLAWRKQESTPGFL